MNKGIIKPTERHIYKLGFNILKKKGTKKSKLIEGALAFYNTIISARNISIGKIYKELSISGNTEPECIKLEIPQINYGCHYDLNL